jgi:uncharacterized membrane protein YGL010W
MTYNNTFIDNFKSYDKLSNKFNEYHSNDINIFIHLITTPLLIFETAYFINKITKMVLITKIMGFIYCISLTYYDLPYNVNCITSYILANLIIISQYIKIKHLHNLIIIVSAYLIQYLSHFMTGEQTYLNSYINISGYASMFIEHTYYILPLVITSSLKSSIIYEKEFFIKLISIIPLLYVYITDYIVNKGYIEYPWQLKKYKLLKSKDYSNLYYITGLSIISYYTNYKVFLIGTSFIHYIRYILTYYYRDNADYMKFKNDVIMYKIISMTQLYYFYISSLQNIKDNFFGISLIITGNILCVYSSYLLGVDGCYFGIELGHINKHKKHIKKFPYGYIQHPMILSQCLVFYGINRNINFYNNYPYLIYAHTVLYVIHMIQEHLDIHRNTTIPE